MYSFERRMHSFRQYFWMGFVEPGNKFPSDFVWNVYWFRNCITSGNVTGSRMKGSSSACGPMRGKRFVCLCTLAFLKYHFHAVNKASEIFLYFTLLYWSANTRPDICRPIRRNGMTVSSDIWRRRRHFYSFSLFYRLFHYVRAIFSLWQADWQTCRCLQKKSIWRMGGEVS